MCDVSGRVHCGLSLRHLPRAELTLWAAGLLGGSALPLGLLALLPLAQWGHFVRNNFLKWTKGKGNLSPNLGLLAGRRRGWGPRAGLWAVWVPLATLLSLNAAFSGVPAQVAHWSPSVPPARAWEGLKQTQDGHAP